MVKRAISCFIATVALTLLLPCVAHAVELPDLQSKYVFVYDATDDRVLAGVGENKQISIASMTKIVTAITAIEMIDDLDETVTVTSEMLSTVEWDESVCGISVGDVLTYRDLLEGMIKPSGGDCARVLAYSLCGDVPTFAKKMNELAARVGVTDSHFVNVSGVEVKGHKSTIHDVALIFAYALQNETFKEVVSTGSYVLSTGDKVYLSLAVKKKATGESDAQRILGGKTGYTDVAGRCLVSYFESQGHTIVMCTAGASGNLTPVYDGIKIVNFVDENYSEQSLYLQGEAVATVPLVGASESSFSVYQPEPVRLFLPNDYEDSLTTTFEGVRSLVAPCAVGDTVGTISYYYQGSLIYEQKVTLDTAIDRVNSSSLSMPIIRFFVSDGGLFYVAVALSVILFAVSILLVVRIVRIKHPKKEKYVKKH